MKPMASSRVSRRADNAAISMSIFSASGISGFSILAVEEETDGVDDAGDDQRGVDPNKGPERTSSGDFKISNPCLGGQDDVAVTLKALRD
jgi:hypothetical protein